MKGRDLKPGERDVHFKVRAIYRTPIDPPVNDTQAVEALREAFGHARVGSYVTLEAVEIETVEAK